MQLAANSAEGLLAVEGEYTEDVEYYFPLKSKSSLFKPFTILEVYPLK